MLHQAFQSSEAVGGRCSVKKKFLKLSQSSQGNTCARVSFSKMLIIKIEREGGDWVVESNLNKGEGEILKIVILIKL